MKQVKEKSKPLQKSVGFYDPNLFRSKITSSTDYQGSAYDTHGNCRDDGMESENVFERLCKRKGWSCRKANAWKNMIKHTDFDVKFDSRSSKWHRLDVKGVKRVGRYDDEKTDGFVWLEIKGPCPESQRHLNLGYNHCNDGWIYGDHAPDYIAFESLDSFAIVPTHKLRALIEEKVDLTSSVDQSHDALYKVYDQRWGQNRKTGERVFRWEKTTLVRKEDVLPLAEYIVEKN